MAAIVVPALVEREFNGAFIKWAEILADPATSGDGIWGPDECRVTMKILTPGDIKTRIIVISHGLGFSKRNGDALTRVPPFQHPRYPWLYCRGITASQLKQYIGADDAAKGLNEYGLCEWTMGFGSVNFDIEATPGSVVPAFVEKESDPITRWLTTDRNDMCFVGTDGNPGGRLTIKQGMSYLVAEKVVKWKWLSVDEQFVRNRDGVAANLDALIGTVNNATFAGYKKHTLLMEAPKIVTRELPVSPNLIFGGGANFKKRIPHSVNVEINMRHLDPKTTSRIGDINYYGHDLALDRRDGKWWRIATLVSTKAGAPAGLYGETDFSTMFNAVPL